MFSAKLDRYYAIHGDGICWGSFAKKQRNFEGLKTFGNSHLINASSPLKNKALKYFRQK